MSDFVWIAAIGLTALLCLSFPRISLRRRQSMDEATLAAFKLMLRHRDLSGVPDSALMDIIAGCINEAKRKNIASNGVDNHWQRRLIGLLDKEADVIESVIRDGSEVYLDRHSTQTLLRYGVIEPQYPPSLSADQFCDAARRGTLYSELDERQSARAFS